MIRFKTTLLKFGEQGDKTGWTYIVIEQKIAEKLKPGIRKSFRVCGKIDDHPIKMVALLPRGNGDFIMPVNAILRKAIRKTKGATIIVEIDEDTTPLKISQTLLACLKDEPAAKEYFTKLPGSHQQYYSKWIESAKTDTTKTKRIAIALNAFSNKLSYSQMMQMQKKDRELF